MVSRYVTTGPVKQDGGLCITSNPHYRMVLQNRADPFHVTPPPPQQAYVPPQGPNPQSNQGYAFPTAPGMRSMPPVGPPTQASTPPQADVTKMPQMQAPSGQLQMGSYLPQGPVRTNQTYYRAPSMQPAPRNSNHHRAPMYPPPVPVYGPLNPLGQQVTVVSNQMHLQFNRPYYQMAHQFQTMPTSQPIYSAFPNQQAPQAPYFYQNHGAAPMNMVPRTGPPSVGTPTGTQGQTHPTPAVPPLNQHPQPPQQPTMKRRRTWALSIIDPTTGKDRSKEIYEGGETPTPESGESSARETPQPNVARDALVGAEFSKLVTQRIHDDTIVVDQEVVLPIASDITQTDGTVNVKLTKKVESVPVSESTLQANTKEFIPEVPKNVPPRETPVVSASAGKDVIVSNKPSKERESPAKGRKPRENLQRIEGGQRETHNEVPVVKRDVVPEQHVVVLPPREVVTVPEIKPILPENVIVVQREPVAPIQVIPSREVNILAKEHLPIQVLAVPPPKEVVNPAKEVPVHHNLEMTTKVKPVSKLKPEQKLNDSKPQVQVVANLGTTVPPQGDSLQSKPKANSDSKKSIKENKASAPSATTSAPTVTQKQQQQQHPANPIPVPVSQPSKPTNKTNKMREINRRGADKEGTDMDAFNTNESTNAALAAENNVAPPQVTTTTMTMTATTTVTTTTTTSSSSPPPPPASPAVDNKQIVDSSEIPLSNKLEKKLPVHKVDVCSIVKDSPKPVKPTAPPAPAEDNEKGALSENDKLVQAKNEANSKANAVTGTDVSSVNNTNTVIDPKPVLPYPYKEHQWSPVNPEGKKQYDRDFLFALQNDPKSKKRPENLPKDLEAALKDASQIKNRLAEPRFQNLRGQHDALYPVYAKSQSQRGPVTKRSSQQGKAKAGSKPNVIHVTLSLREDVKLHEAENAWRPARLKESNLSEDDDKTTELYKKVRGVLNKLTPQKFSTLLSQVRDLNIDNCQRLQGVIDLVFEKAVDEPNFSVAYALMCRELALLQVPAERKNKNDPEYVNFRKLLITRCQLEFEKNSVDESARTVKVKEIEAETDPEKKKELQIILEEEDRRVRVKSVGNVRFIGELFKQQMLTVNIMLRCMNNLLTSFEEESLECLCKLLITIGKDLELVKNENLQPFFGVMQDIVDKKHSKISSRVRFMLQDVIELRNNKWVPRRQDLKPTTMDQIQKEADTEQLNIQLMNSAPMNTPRKDDRGPTGGDRKRGGRSNMSDDGWSTATSRGNRVSAYTVEMSKLKSNKPTAVVDEVQLGSRNAFSNWGRGSNIKNPPPSLTNTGNMYAALEAIGAAESERTRPPALGNASRNRYVGSSSRNGNKDPYNSKGPSIERSYKFDDGRGSRSGSQARSRDGSQARQQAPASAPMQTAPQAPPPRQAPVKLTDEQLEQRTIKILTEYIRDISAVAISEQDTVLQHVEQEIRITFPAHSHGKFVQDCYNDVLERKASAREATGRLIARLGLHDVFSLQSLCEGLTAVFEIVDDLTIDIPKIWDYLSELIVPLLAEGVLSLAVFNETASILIKQGHAGKLYAKIFKQLMHDKGPSYIRELWTASGLQLSDFVPSNEVANYVESNNLEFLSGTTSAPVAGQIMPFDKIRSRLLSFFQSDSTFDNITEWVMVNIGNKTTDKVFIRALMTAVCEHSIVKCKVNVNILKSHYNLLQRYVDNKEQHELQCLYALQALICKLDHPQGVLFATCQQLWEDNVLSSDAFLTWEQCTDLSEQEGKGVALKSLTSLFIALKEDGDSSASEAE